jgi:hypothetical protein
MTFHHALGNIQISNGELIIKNMQMNAFEGQMGVSGKYSAADTLKAKVNFDMNIRDVTFSSIFGQTGWLQSFAPILEKATGHFSTNISINSQLKPDMMPDLATFAGSGDFKSQSVGLSNVPALDLLATTLKKSNLMPMTLKDVTLAFEIKDGKLSTKPFSFKAGDIGMTLGGTTGLDQSIAYTGKVQMPDNLSVGKLSSFDVKIGGTFTKPTVKVDLAGMAKEIVDEKIQEIRETVTEKIDETKAKAIEEARKKAEKLLAETDLQTEKLIAEAKKQGEALVAKAGNPIAKKAAEVAAKKLVDEAQKKADALKSKSKTESDDLIKKAENL